MHQSAKNSRQPNLTRLSPSDDFRHDAKSAQNQQNQFFILARPKKVSRYQASISVASRRVTWVTGDAKIGVDVYAELELDFAPYTHMTLEPHASLIRTNLCPFGSICDLLQLAWPLQS